MKIYFCGSIRGGRQLVDRYQLIIGFLRDHGEVLTEHVGDDAIVESGEGTLSDREIHDRDMCWIVESDVIVAEVTIPSLGVGYEIGRAIEMKKPVLCLFHSGSEFSLSAMISGSAGVVLQEYTDAKEIRELLIRFLALHVPRRIS